MIIVLDTHVLLWYLMDDPKLHPTWKYVLSNYKNKIFVSTVSAWEITVKKALKKLEYPDNLEKAVETSGFEWLNITLQHIQVLGNLPLHHNDPFDQLLVAQAIAEKFIFATVDTIFYKYPVQILKQ